jgi:hypothetical protein
MRLKARWLWLPVLVVGLLYGPGSCGGGGSNDICKCSPDRPEIDDYRHAEKHVPIPSIPPIETTVAGILAWPQDTDIPNGTPRSGRELQVFHVANAFVQWVGLNPGDCDIHVEISQTADKNAPRVIVETPGEKSIDDEYCTARRTLQSQLAAHKVTINGAGMEVTPALPGDVLGLAFEDFEHTRGTALVATVWEIHPAVVTLH